MTFLLVSGASGAGKSSVRALVAPALAPRVESVELRDLVEIPRFPDLAWRQRTTECAVRRALALQAEGRHLLLAGDPVLLPRHVAFADWMRNHAADPAWMPHVLTGGGWPEMRWERWSGWRRGDPRRQVHVIDTTALTIPEVGAEVRAWAGAALSR